MDIKVMQIIKYVKNYLKKFVIYLVKIAKMIIVKVVFNVTVIRIDIFLNENVYAGQVITKVKIIIFVKNLIVYNNVLNAFQIIPQHVLFAKRIIITEKNFYLIAIANKAFTRCIIKFNQFARNVILHAQNALKAHQN